MKQRIQTIKLLIFLFSAFPISISAKDIYVSPNGNDNNPGTKNQPLKTILQVIIPLVDSFYGDFILYFLQLLRIFYGI